MTARSTPAASVLSHDQARSFYDRFGARQDQQAFYEDKATGELIQAASFERAAAVFELGCGTGRFASQLLERHLPATARYLACDISTTMVGLARERLAHFGNRVEIRQTEGSPLLDVAPGSYDRFVSNYVLDLLSEGDIATVISEAGRVLERDGKLCLVSLTAGSGLVSRQVTRLWSWIHAQRPGLVGGCRPIELRRFVGPPAWQLEYHRVVVAFGIASEVLVARRS